MSNRSSHFVHRLQTLPSALMGASGSGRLLALAAVLALLALTALALMTLGPRPASAQADDPPEPPVAPDRPTATAIYEGMVDLEWNDVPGATSYDVQAFKSDWFDLPGNGVGIAFYGPGAIIRDLIPESRYYFRVRANNALGSSEWSEHRLVDPTGGDFGNWDGVPEPTNRRATGAPTISGMAQVDETLTADLSAVVDENGLDRVQFHYQWVSNDGTDDSAIYGATKSTYTLRSYDESKTVKVRVSFTDRGGYQESRTSAATEAVGPPNNPATGAPTISGATREGETLTADTSGIADADRLTNAVFGYQWLADDTIMAGATESTYTLLRGDVGKTIKVQVSFTDDEGNEETLTSVATEGVVPDPGPLTVFMMVDTSTDPDTLLGTLLDGGTLTLDNPTGGSYTIRVDTDLGHDDHGDIHKVKLDLDGPKIVDRTRRVSPYSLYGEDSDGNVNGENLPVGDYTLKATVHTENDDVLGTLQVSFTINKTLSIAGNANPEYPENAAVPVATYIADPKTPNLDWSLSGDDGGRFSVIDGVLRFLSPPDFEKPADQGGDNEYQVEVVTTDSSKSRATIAVTIKVTDVQDPNIVLIMADDVGYEAFGAYGSTQYRTPRLDELASAGVRLTNAYSKPVCTPSRVALMTGKSNVRNYADFGVLLPDQYTFADLLGEAGYATAIAGKWQLHGGDYSVIDGVAADQTGFDAYCLWNTDLADGSRYWNPSIECDGQVISRDQDDYGPDIFTDFLLEFIESNQNGPFFAYYPMVLPHYPFVPPPDAQCLGTDDEQCNFEDMVSRLDYNVGRIYDKLATLLLLDNTILLFTSDNGTSRTLVSYLDGKAIQGDKRLPTDGGTRVPLIAIVPGGDGGRVIDDLIDFTDFLPTFADAAGLTVPEEVTLDGVSFWERLQGKTGQPRQWIYTYYFPNPYKSTYQSPSQYPEVAYVRDERYKLYSTGDLYDLSMDTHEIRPVLSNEGDSLEARTRLQAALDSMPATSQEIRRPWVNDALLSSSSRPLWRPVLKTATVDGNELKLTYAGVLDIDSKPPEGAFAVQVDGTERTVSSVSVAAGVVTLTLATPVTAGQTVTLSYTPGTNALQHANRVDGNTATALAHETVRNETPQDTSATDALTISGRARVGETLTADVSTIADDDELTNAVFVYQWLRGDAEIAGATGATYTVVEADEGRTIKVRVSFTDAEDNPETLTSEPTGPVVPDPGPLTVFKVVDTSSNPDTVLGTLEDGGALSLANPASDSYGIRVDTDSGHDDHGDIHKVVLALSGAKTEGKEEWVTPYSLYGDEGEGNLTGENLPAGAYELTATAYKKDGDVLGTLKVSFTVAAGQPAQQPTVVPNTSATGLPIIDGTVQVGETLTADVAGIADADGLDAAEFSYQWLADDEDIAGATGSGYTLAEDDEGKTIKVTVSFTDDAGNQESLPSDPTGEVVPDPGPLTVFTVVDTFGDTDTVLGTLEDGGTLTLEDPASDSYGIRVDTDSGHDDHGDIHKVELDLTGAKTRNKEEGVFPYSLYGDDGEGNLTGEDLPAGAYELKATAYKKDGDVLGTLKVSFTVTAGQPAQQPAVVPNTSATGVPTISGTPQVGETLTADTSGIADEDGLTNVTFSYQWMADDEDIAGATGSSHTLTEDDEGKTIKVTVSFTDAEGNPETLTSAATDAVAPDPGTLTGFALLDASDQTVVATLSEGDEVGLPDPADGIYTIRADAEPGTAIGSVKLELTGAKDASRTEDAVPYLLYGDGAADGLHGEVLPAGAYTLRATAYSERDGGGAVLETDAISFTVNSPTRGEPAITGQPRVGKTLTANTSQIADKDGLTHATFSYQWVRNDGNVDTEIGEANGSTYTLTEDDEGKTITVTVIFTDDGGTQETATSSPTSRVKAEGDRPTSNGTTVYLTFDDGPHPVYTPQILDVLESYGAKAMFFVTGVNVELYPEIIARMAADGHGIGNHTWGHERLPDLTEEEFNETITRTQDAIGETASPCLRPPYGAITSRGRRLAESLGFQVVMWTLPNPAWDGTWVDSFVSHIVPNLRDGSIVLMHDGDGHGKAVLALNKILEQGTNKGNRFEPVCQPPELEEEENPHNNTATGLPIITGAAQVGETLTADTSGIADADGLTNVVFSYQWVRNDGTADTDIQDATGSTHTLVKADKGRTIKVTVSFTDDAGNPETLTSDPTGEVAAKPNTQATGQPTIGGIAQVGQTLTASTAGIADADGLEDATFSYQWRADDTEIQGATGSSYTLAADDEGRTIKVTVSFTDAEGNPETLTSDPTGAVEAAPNTSATGQPTINGTIRVGETLTADTSGIADEDGLTNAVFSYQWVADDEDIAEATGSSYILTEDDEGKAIKVTVSFTDAEGNPETLTSEPTGEVEAKPNTSATGVPTIDGTAQVGQTLTADTSSIDDVDGLNQVVFSYQWIRNDGNADADIAGATGSSYTLTEDDEGTVIKVTVSFTDEAGNPETRTSDATGEVESQAGPLSGFTLVDAADTDQAVLWKHQTDGSKPEEGDRWKEWTDGGTLALGDPENGSYGIRADTESGEGIHRVALELTLESTGEKQVERTDDAAPYSLYGDEGEDALHGESLPVGSYTLKATAYTEDGETLGSLEVSFTVALAKPGKPQDLEGEATAQEIKLTWKVPTGSVVVEYVVYRGVLRNGSMNGQALSKHTTIDAAGKAMSYTDDNVEEGAEYRYRVAAVNTAGEGKKSTWLDIEAG